MSDLPEIRNGHKKEEMAYGGEPFSHFQRKVNFDNKNVKKKGRELYLPDSHL